MHISKESQSDSSETTKSCFKSNDEPNAPGLRMEDAIPLKEVLMKRAAMGTANDMKHADMLNEKIMNSKEKMQLQHN
jgi:hypothetical protein